MNWKKLNKAIGSTKNVVYRDERSSGNIHVSTPQISDRVTQQSIHSTIIQANISLKNITNQIRCEVSPFVYSRLYNGIGY